MSKYVLNENTALIVNGEVFVLAREKEVTKNSVCDKCALFDICADIEDNRNLSKLCVPPDNDQRWFFKRHAIYTKKGAQNLVQQINKDFINK